MTFDRVFDTFNLNPQMEINPSTLFQKSPMPAFHSVLTNFQVILANKGDIDAVFSYLPSETLFGQEFTFVPTQGIVRPGGYQAIQVFILSCGAECQYKCNTHQLSYGKVEIKIFSIAKHFFFMIVCEYYVTVIFSMQLTV